MGKLKLSALCDVAAGSAGGLTVARGRSGPMTVSPPRYRRSISPDQAASMARMERAGLAWETLDEVSVEAWRRHAVTIIHTNKVNGVQYRPLAFNLFSGLFCKLQQIDPSAEPPAWPPQGSFAGDRIGLEVGVSLSPDGSFGREGRGERSRMLSPLPQPPLQDEPLGEGALLYVASGANAPGVLTELLYQKLPGRHRLPKPKSKSAGFKAFTDEDRTFTLLVEPGYYFCAYAFVEASTGRTTHVRPLGTVAVGGA